MPEEKAGQRLILMDGTTIEDGSCRYADGNLWCWVTGYTLQQAAGIFFDDSKTRKIIFQYGEMEDVYEGFTVCIRLVVDQDGTVSVCMERG